MYSRDELRIPLRLGSTARSRHTEVSLSNLGNSPNVHGSLNWANGQLKKMSHVCMAGLYRKADKTNNRKRWKK